MTLPEAFLSHSREILGEARFALLTDGLASPSLTSIRLNPRKSAGKEVSPTLSPRRVAWCPTGFYLGERPNFTFDPLLHGGAYYVQEASSMFVDEVVRQYVHQPVTALDLCAAPGGKTTALQAALPEGSVVVSNEYVRTRAAILAENVAKWGYPDVVVTNNSTGDLRRCGVNFDFILADVPCSGEGMFRKDEGAIAEWSVQNVENCRRLQREILADAWACLRPGGWLIYSTCTINLHEDEENIAWAMEQLDARLLDIHTQPSWAITGSLLPSLGGSVCRFIPGISEGEGLFMALLQKAGEAMPIKEKSAKVKRQRTRGTAPAAIPPEASRWIEHSDRYVAREYGDVTAAIPKAWASLYDQLGSLRILHAGIPLGTRRGRDLLPAPALALSTELRPEAFTRQQADYASAIAYLRKEAITLPADAPRDIVLVEYEGTPLGFVKNVGNRANNLYPQEWRIRSSHLPEGLKDVLRASH